MAIFVVSKNHLIRDMLATTLNARQLKVEETLCTVAALGSISQDDIVVIHDPSSVREAKADIDALSQNNPSVRIILVPERSNLQRMAAAFTGRIAAIVPDDSSSEALVSAVSIVNEGFGFSSLSELNSQNAGLNAQHTHRTMRPTPVAHGADTNPATSLAKANLSDREVSVLKLLSEGESNKVIANHLYIAEATVKSHLRSIFLKTGCSNRALVAVWFSKNF